MYMVSQVHSCLFGSGFPLFPLLGCVNPPELLLIPGAAARSFQRRTQIVALIAREPFGGGSPVALVNDVLSLKALEPTYISMF